MKKRSVDEIDELQAQLRNLNGEIVRRDIIIASLSEEQIKVVGIRSHFRKLLGAIDRSAMDRIENVKKREIIDRTDEADRSIARYSEADTPKALLDMIHDYDDIAFVVVYESHTAVSVVGEVLFGAYKLFRLVVRKSIFTLNASMKKIVGLLR